jgi:DNA-binding NtrC family response regulator
MAQILIVSDSVENLAMLAMIVTDKTSHKATTTNNPFEVPKLIQEGAFDLLIINDVIKGMNVAELIAKVRKIDKSIPIHIVTAGGFEESAE